uniref:Major facilitator superfamily (MFS) profile domain-containing protein n=1 Tax=Daucus carota subsp. sativus TaxID=79200 RepID=A0A162AIU5_DAUCS
MYKRTMSRDNANEADLEDSSAPLQNGVGQDITNPSWKRSLPHVLLATIVPFLFGYHLGVVNEPLESISSDLGFKGDTLAEGLVVSICLGGAFVGSLLSGWIADGFGRRRAFQLCVLPMILGASISASTNNVAGMLLGRFLVGTGLGIGPPVASLYITEVSPPFVRGTYGSFIQIATCAGIMGALLIGIPVKDISGWWRICFWVSTIPAAILAIFMEFAVESPHWLYKILELPVAPYLFKECTDWLWPSSQSTLLPINLWKKGIQGCMTKEQGRISEAEVQFEKVLGGWHVNAAMAELMKSDRGDEIENVTVSDLICGRHFRVVYIGSALFALQQLSGINAVFYFSSTVFRSAGVSSNLANAFVGITNLVGSVIALTLMDKVGRKGLLIWSFSGMVVSTGIQVAAAGAFASTSIAEYLSVGGMLAFVFSFAVGAGPVPGLLLSEIFPNRIRAKAMAFCMSVHWVFNFLVGLLFLRLLERMGPQLLYTMFGTFCLMAVFFVKNNVMETKGKSLQEIEISLLPSE